MRVKYDKRQRTLVRKATKGSAGYDIPSLETLIIPPGLSAKIDTGVYIDLNDGWEGTLRHRSGMHSKQGALVAGTIDSDYEGELKVTVTNLHPGNEIRIKEGQYIAQLVISPVYTGPVLGGIKVGEEDRGDGGHGSTGA